MESFVAKRGAFGTPQQAPGIGHEMSQVAWLCPEELSKGGQQGERKL